MTSERETREAIRVRWLEARFVEWGFDAAPISAPPGAERRTLLSLPGSLRGPAVRAALHAAGDVAWLLDALDEALRAAQKLRGVTFPMDLPAEATPNDAMRGMIKYAMDGTRLLTNAVESGKVDECVRLRATKMHSLALAFLIF